MTGPFRWMATRWRAGRQWWRNSAAARSVPSLVPIRPLSERHRARILQHLMGLSSGDRYLRFGYTASDAQIERYVAQLDFKRDDVFGIFNRRLELVAMAHLAYTQLPAYSNCAEFGVSVSESARGLRLGTRLFARAVLHARNKGVDMMFIHALSENTAMLKIARHAGARVQRDGAESEAYLQLPAGNLDTRVTQVVGDRVAAVDYQFKKQAKQFWTILAHAQEMRQSAQDQRQWSE